MAGNWRHGICGCFDNIGVCIVTYVVPCYTFGLNAETVGESCMTCAIAYFVPILNIIALMQVRGKIREQKGISGSGLNDLCMICFCHFCALVQEAQEVKDPGILNMARE